MYLAYITVVLVGRWLHNRNRQDVPYTVQENAVVTGDPPEIQLVPESTNCTGVRENTRLLLSALNPIPTNWHEASVVYKAYYIFKAPVDVLFRLTNPVVDQEEDNEGWCQYQAVIQTSLGPTFSVFACAVALDSVY